MATFTYTPELPVAELLSSVLGKAAGAISSSAIKTINKLQKQLDDICLRIARGDKSAYAELGQIEAVLDAIEASLNALESSLEAIEAALTTIKVALVVAKIALIAAEIVAAIPYMPPILAIACQILSELIAQITQIVSALLALVKSILSILKPILEMLKRLRKLIKSIYVGQALDEALEEESVTDKDLQDLKDAGLIDDSGQNIFNKVANSMNSEGSSVLSFGGGSGGSDSTGGSFSASPGNGSNASGGNGNNGSGSGNKGSSSSNNENSDLDNSNTSPTGEKANQGNGENGTGVEGGNSTDNGVAENNSTEKINENGSTGSEKSDKINESGSIGETGSESLRDSSKNGVVSDTEKTKNAGKDATSKKDSKGLDLTNTEILNQILSTGDKDTILNIPISNCGDWVADIYKKSKDKPDIPKGKGIPPEGWTTEEPEDLENWWWSRVTVSGKTGRSGQWSKPVDYKEKPIKSKLEGKNVEGKYSNTSLSGRNMETVRLGVVHLKPDTDISRYSLSPIQYAVVIPNPEVAYDFIISMLGKLSNSPIGNDLKLQIRGLLDTVENPTVEDYTLDPNLYYTDLEGNVYTLTVVVDPKSPAISPLRYVEVTDSSGTVIYTGTKTFATDIPIILEETKVRLYELLR